MNAPARNPVSTWSSRCTNGPVIVISARLHPDTWLIYYQAARNCKRSVEAVDNRIYKGERNIDGAEVTVDGEPLDTRLDLHTFTSRGFEWGYEGNGPKQLALAILADYFEDDAQAKAECRAFMSRVVAYFSNEWEMTSADIDLALANVHAAN